MTYHVHIYEVKNKYEVDINENSQKEARAKAIKIYKEEKNKLKRVSSDCNIIVIAFKVDYIF